LSRPTPANSTAGFTAFGKLLHRRRLKNGFCLKARRKGTELLNVAQEQPKWRNEIISATFSKLFPPFGVYLSAVKEVEAVLISSSGLFGALLQEY